MIQKILITIFIFIIVFYGYRILKKINLNTTKNKNNDESIIDLEKDPKTNEYKPKE